MAFNADEHVAALLPPVFIAGGRKYRGRILSVEEVGRIYATRPTPTVQSKTPAEVRRIARESRRFMRRCVEAWFPAPWPLRLLGINPAWRAFRALPDATQIDAMESFTLAQRMAMPNAGHSLSDDDTAAPPPANE